LQSAGVPRLGDAPGALCSPSSRTVTKLSYFISKGGFLRRNRGAWISSDI
jgi:hypothetical protein